MASSTSPVTSLAVPVAVPQFTIPRSFLRMFDPIFIDYVLRDVSPIVQGAKVGHVYSVFSAKLKAPIEVAMLRFSGPDVSQQILHFIKDHMRLLRLAKVVYYFPECVLNTLNPLPANTGEHPLPALAESIAMTFGCEIFVHYSADHGVCRIGQILDQTDHHSTDGYTELGCFKSNQADSHYINVDGGHLPHQLSDPIKALINSASTAIASRAVEHIEIDALDGADALVTASKIAAEKIPKPKNSWIIFRLQMYRQNKQKWAGYTAARMSKIISAEWKRLTADELRVYEVMAEVEKSEHALLYPGYKCKPRKSSQIKRRQTNKKPTTELHVLNGSNLGAMVVNDQVIPTQAGALMNTIRDENACTTIEGFQYADIDHIFELPKNDELLNEDFFTGY